MAEQNSKHLELFDYLSQKRKKEKERKEKRIERVRTIEASLGCISSLLQGRLAINMPTLREDETQSKIGFLSHVSLVRNRWGWDRGCGSQTPVYPDAAGDCEELDTEAHRPAVSLGQGGIWLSSK